MRRRLLLVVPAVVSVLALAAPVTAIAAPAPAPRPTPWVSQPVPVQEADPSLLHSHLLDEVAVVDGVAVAVGAVQRVIGSSVVRKPWVGRLVDGTWTRDAVPPVENNSTDESLHGVDGVAADDVWAVGHRVPGVAPSIRTPYAAHFDGTAWTPETLPTPTAGVAASVTAVVARAADDVWAVGPSGSGAAVWHRDADGWTATRVRTVTGCATNRAFQFGALASTPAGVLHAGGSCTTAAGATVAIVARMIRPGSWEVVARVPSRTEVVDVVADDAGTVWATGNQQTADRQRPFLISGSGADWTTRFRAESSSVTERVSGLALTALGVTLVGETNSNLDPRAPFATTWTGRAWRPATVATPTGDNGWLTAVDGSPTGAVVAVGQYFGEKSVVLGFSASPAT